MSKVVIFNGSPRKNGYTTKLLEQVAKGAKSKGAEIIEFKRSWDSRMSKLLLLSYYMMVARLMIIYSQ
ncbi:NADPH-dependent FMN reductase [Clostridium sp. BL-8]|nr:NADPH-dependent FMN reductase [Clostridium sp. BL-8]